jgi:hypothetical protein
MYAKMAESFFHQGVFSIHGVQTNFYPPLYPVLLSAAYVFRDMQWVYIAMQMINALISSLVIFPAWLLCREFFENKKALQLAFLCSILPFSFSFSPYIMAENLFFPLFLFSFYFLYKSFADESIRWDILAGISTALLFLTKINGAFIIPAAGIVFVISLFRKQFFQIKKKIVMIISFILVYLPWMIRNISLFGLNFSQILGLGGYYSEAEFIAKPGFPIFGFLLWIFLYAGFLILASGIIPSTFFCGVFSRKPIKEKKNEGRQIFTILLLISIVFTFVIGAYHNATSPSYSFSWLPGRPMGRYVDFLIPLLLIGGFLGICDEKVDRKELIKKTRICFGALLVMASLLTIFPLLPANNLSLSWAGTINVLLNFIFFKRTAIGGTFFSIWLVLFFAVFFLGVLAFSNKIAEKTNFRQAIVILSVFFLLINGINFALTSYNSINFWDRGEQNQIGKWFNKYDAEYSKILFDKEDCTEQLTRDRQEGICDKGHISTLMGFWMNDDIRISNVGDAKDYDYVVSRKKLDYEILKETSNGVHLYKVI